MFIKMNSDSMLLHMLYTHEFSRHFDMTAIGSKPHGREGA